MRDPAVRILVDEKESGASGTPRRWFVATVQLLAIGFLFVFAIVFRFGDDTVRASPPTVVVDVYLTDGVGSDEAEQMLDRFGAEKIVIDSRLARKSPLLQARIPPTECDLTVSIRLLVANMRNANAITQLVSEWYPYPDSAVGPVRTQQGDLESHLSLDCS